MVFYEGYLTTIVYKTPPNSRIKMKNMTLRIASINHPPYIIVNETSAGTWEVIGGVDSYVINILRQKFRFKYEVFVPVDKAWGEVVNGTWNGVIGMVYRNEVDLGIANMMMTQSRYEAVEFSIPYNSDGWVLVARAPRFYENQQAVLKPFSKEVWCALLVSVLFSTFFLFILQYGRSCFKRTPSLSLRNTLWNIVAVLCQAGAKLEKMKCPALVYFITWIFSAMVLQVSYSGTLVGFLTFPEREPSISSLSELAVAIKSRGFKISYKKFSLAESLLMNHERYGAIFTETINSHSKSRVPDHLSGFNQVLKEKFVFIANEFGCIYDSYKDDFTRLQMSTVLNRNYISIAVSRQFRYLKEFNEIIRRISERGLIMKWRSDILSRRLMKTMFEEKCHQYAEVATSKTKPLKISHLQGAFVLLGGGYFIASVSLIVEILYIRYLPLKERKKSSLLKKN